MRAEVILIAIVLMAGILTGCGSEQPAVDNPSGGITVKEIAAQTPQHAKLLFENDYVMVADFHIEPGDKIPSHYGRNRAVYALNDFKLKFIFGENEIIEETKQNTIHWHNEGIHSAENVGDEVARFIVVFRKLSRLFEYSVIGGVEDFTCVAPGKSEVLVENTYMRVARFTLPPGESLPRHRGLNRVTYALSAFKLKYVSDDFTHIYVFDKGQVRYHEADTHAIENIGKTEAVYLMFELKE